jgi:hypothetical protein
VSDPRRFTAQTKLAQHERRVTNLERRMLDLSDDPDEPGCCALYCDYGTPGETIAAFNIVTPLSISIPRATSCRLEIDWCVSYSQSSSGNFSFQPQLFLDGHVRRPIMPFQSADGRANDMQPVSGCDVIDVLGAATDITVDLQVFNTGANTITLQDGMMKIRKQGRHGAITCSPGQVGQ